MLVRGLEQKNVVCRALTVCAIIVSVWVVAACNTTQGVGEDIEAAGEGIQNAAD